MMRLRLSILLIFMMAEPAMGQKFTAVKKDDILKLFQPDSGMVVINAWATYCKPCLEELPLFRKADSMYAAAGVKFIFLSFDFTDDSNRIARVFTNAGLSGKSLVADETDMNMLINAMDESWTGGLPATWFISPLYRKPVFYGFRQFDDIQKEIELLIAASNENP